MTRLTLLSVLLIILPAVACQRGQDTDTSAVDQQAAPPSDPHSYANPESVRVSHLALDLAVDFEAKQMVGSATLSLEREPGSTELRLDTRDLTIERVLLDGEAETAFALGNADPMLGQQLTVPLAEDTETVTVYYSTSPSAAALQWLGPAQTAGGEHPFLFTQSQAILARTWVPCQDTPAVRMTYEATVRVPNELMAVMSAENGTETSEHGTYTFSMPQPIPSYLLALAVGKLEFRSIGERSGVYAEAAIVDKAAWEFAEVEEMIDVAERLYGPYRWGRYDLLVLPPSFPFGGMENPRLTFATPTILAGDRSLVALVAHELAHSWSGNLVTNATWNDFWLNEGFTTYIEQRLMEELYGTEYSEMLVSLGLQDLRGTLEALGPESPDGHLFLDLAGRDPDEGMSDVAYEKGASFLRALEHAVGRERWDAFLAEYFDTFAFRSLDTATFVDYLKTHLADVDPDLYANNHADEWLHGSGLPANTVEPESAAFTVVDEAVAAWASGATADSLETDGWNTHQWRHFLRNLPSDLNADQLGELDGAFAFTESGNSEILCEWLLATIRGGYDPAKPALEEFLLTVGRRKFLRPLYAELSKTDAGLEWAREVYVRARPGYHAVSSGTIDQLLGLEESL